VPGRRTHTTGARPQTLRRAVHPCTCPAAASRPRNPPCTTAPCLPAASRPHRHHSHRPSLAAAANRQQVYALHRSCAAQRTKVAPRLGVLLPQGSPPPRTRDQCSPRSQRRYTQRRYLWQSPLPCSTACGAQRGQVRGLRAEVFAPSTWVEVCSTRAECPQAVRRW
jgi:hypothetical protein